MYIPLTDLSLVEKIDENPIYSYTGDFEEYKGKYYVSIESFSLNWFDNKKCCELENCVAYSTIEEAKSFKPEHFINEPKVYNLNL